MTERRWIAAASAVAAGILLLLPSSASAASEDEISRSGPGHAFTRVPVTGEALTRVPATGQAPPRMSASRSALEVQRRLQGSRAGHRRAVQRLAVLQRHLALLTEQAERAAHGAATAAEELETSAGVFDALGDWVTGDDELDRAHDVLSEAQHLSEVAAIAERGVVDARRQVRHTGREHRAARSAAQRMQLSTAARASARLAQRWSRLSAHYRASSADQDRHNRLALATWQRHLTAMGDAGIVAPPADDLEHRELPSGLRPARDGVGRLIPGMALARGRDGAAFEVVPDVTVRAVSAAFGSLGTVSSDRSCAEFVHGIWDTAQVDVPADGASLWRSTTAVVERQVVLGDVVFFRRTTGHGIGVSVGEGRVIAFDPSVGEIAVETVGASELVAVRRVTLSPERGTRVAAVPSWVARDCRPPLADPVLPPALSAGDWVLPVAEGSFSMSAGFGAGGARWSSGSHTGQDFAAPLGTPVMAVAEGRVTVERVSWAGQLVRVDHGGGVETWYAHMSAVDVTTGDVVRAGSVVGAVGSEGNSTGPHLHFEVRVHSSAVEPMTFLSTRAAL